MSSSLNLNPERIVVLAGNPRVEKSGSRIIIEPQEEAFTEAMQLVERLRGSIVKIYIAFDHRGVFRDQFLKPTTSNRKCKKASLAYTIEEIQQLYRPIAQKYEVELGDIGIITEAECRMHMLQIFPEIPERYRWVVGQKGAPFCDKDGCDDYAEEEKLRINCKGIAAEIIRRMASHGNRIEAFWEFDKRRCRPETVDGGTTIARHLFNEASQANICHHMIFHKTDGTLVTRTWRNRVA